MTDFFFEANGTEESLWFTNDEFIETLAMRGYTKKKGYQTFVVNSENVRGLLEEWKEGVPDVERIERAVERRYSAQRAINRLVNIEMKNYTQQELKGWRVLGRGKYLSGGEQEETDLQRREYILPTVYVARFSPEDKGKKIEGIFVPEERIQFSVNPEILQKMLMSIRYSTTGREPTVDDRLDDLRDELRELENFLSTAPKRFYLKIDAVKDPDMSGWYTTRAYGTVG